MKKKEFKIGEEFQLGLKRLRVEEGSACERCYFGWLCMNNDVDIADIVGYCTPVGRKDNKMVIFKEVEE